MATEAVALAGTQQSSGGRAAALPGKGWCPLRGEPEKLEGGGVALPEAFELDFEPEFGECC